MTFRHLEAFIQVALQGGFTRAADKLCLTQPTVSGQIKELEQELGVSLFHRLPRVVQLTEAGELLLPRARELLGSRESLLEWVAAYRGLLWGRLTVHASTIPGEYLLPPLLAAFKREYPEILLTLRIQDSGEVLEQLRRSEAALGVVGKQDNAGGLEFRPLWQDRIALFAACKAPTGPRLGLDDLRREPVVVREEGSGTRRAVEGALKSQGLPMSDLNVVSEFGSTTAVKQAVAAGIGVGFLSDVSVGTELTAGTLREVAIDGLPPLTRRFYVAWDPDRALSPACERFRDFLLASSSSN
jgi:DNA-binding transcriptional LysR family regulator